MKVRLSKSGVHYFDREHGLNILLDEIVVDEDKWHRAPRYVSIALTNVCDLACHFCYAPKNRAALDLKVVKEWLIELDNNGTLGVGFGGGEPTLYKQLPELCAFASNNTGLAVSFTSHGHNLSDELLQKLQGNIHFVRISIDGLEQTYERLRNRSFYKLVQIIENVKSIVPFGINYVVNDYTIGDMDQAVDFAINIGASEILFLPERKVNEGTGILQPTLIAMKKRIKQHMNRIPLKISYDYLGDLPICDPFLDDEPLVSYAHIDAYGVIKQSSFDKSGMIIKDAGIMIALQELKSIKKL